MHEKSRSGLAIALGGLALLVASGSARAGGGGILCHCPPPLTWCSEQAPCVIFKCACPRPVCDPCDLQHYGYYLTCWRPWPFQPDWSHCQSPPPGVTLPPPAYPPYTPRAPQDRRSEPSKEDEFPKPRRTEPKDQMESPQVRNMGYRVVEQAPAPVPVAPRRVVEQAPAPVPPAPRRIVEEPSAPVRQLEPVVIQRLEQAPSAPVPQPETTRAAVRFIR